STYPCLSALRSPIDLRQISIARSVRRGPRQRRKKRQPLDLFPCLFLLADGKTHYSPCKPARLPVGRTAKRSALSWLVYPWFAKAGRKSGAGMCSRPRQEKGEQLLI